MVLKNKILILFILLASKLSFAQQLPFWTQHRSNYFIVNPAVTGARKTIDTRMNYRYQWVGFDGSPKTLSIGAHGNFFKTKMGAGLFVYQDKIGPQQISTIAGSFAFHFPVQDMKLSMGLNGSYNVNALNVNNITYLNSHDALINNAVSYNKAKIPNMAAGFMLHNEKFYVGFAMNNMFGNSYKFRENKKAANFTNLTTVPHFNVAVGYNWTENGDFIWENSLMTNYVSNTPILIDYNLKLHIKNALFVGAGIRLRAAIYGQIGYTINGMGQIGYSFDYNTNALMKTNYGSHEIKIAYVFNQDQKMKHKGGKGFSHQHYQYML
jgi:type IX secretion system PorP/SprF family membrane protein